MCQNANTRLSAMTTPEADNNTAVSLQAELTRQTRSN